MIWANATRFGQNFIAPQIILGWYAYGQIGQLRCKTFLQITVILGLNGEKFVTAEKWRVFIF